MSSKLAMTDHSLWDNYISLVINIMHIKNITLRWVFVVHIANNLVAEYFRSLP